MEKTHRIKRISSIVALCLVMIFAMTSFAGCSFSQEKDFIGTWYEINEAGEKIGNSGMTLVFAKYGEGSVTENGISGSIKWSIEKGNLFITASVCGMARAEEYTYEFSSFGKKLTLIDTKGAERIFTK